jgi:hypothetical protein
MSTMSTGAVMRITEVAVVAAGAEGPPEPARLSVRPHPFRPFRQTRCEARYVIGQHLATGPMNHEIREQPCFAGLDTADLTTDNE